MIEFCYIKSVQKQPLAAVLQNRCPCKFCKIHRKLSVLESLFSKVASLRGSSTSDFYDFCETLKKIL